MQCPDCGQAYPEDAIECACGFDFVQSKASPTPRQVGWHSPSVQACAISGIACSCAAGLLYREHWPYVMPVLAGTGLLLAAIGGALAGRREPGLSPADLVPMVRGAATCLLGALAVLCIVLAGSGLGDFTIIETVALGLAALLLGALAAILAGHRAPGFDRLDVLMLVLLVIGTLCAWLAKGLFSD